MQELGIALSEKDIHDMMKSVSVGPRGKISYAGKSFWLNRCFCPLVFLHK
jgi:hypothetical protein